MAVFTIEYTKTERTRERIDVEADSVADAIAAVENYEIDNSEAWEVGSLEWSIADAEFVAVDDGPRTIEARFQIVGTPDRDGDMLTLEQLTERLTITGTRNSPGARSELRDQPEAADMCSGMWGGWRDAKGEYVFLTDDNDPTSEPTAYNKGGPIAYYVVRYETWAAYEALSR